MGKTIEQLAENQNIEIAWKISSQDQESFDAEKIREADVVIEFTRPDAAFGNVMRCLEAGVPVVSGTTGWLNHLSEAKQFCLEKNGAMLWASNFSIGVNLFFALNQRLAALMAPRPEYAASLTEIHHIHKLDAPSGTALSLVRQVMEQNSRYKGWSLSPDLAAANEIPVTAIRDGEVPGTHILHWKSTVDEITIEHRALSRTGFAAGALLAAQWIYGKNGVFEMSDVLGL